MPAILFLLLCMFTGCILCDLFLPQLKTMGEKSFLGKPLKLSNLLFLFPAWFLIGTLIVTWAVYLIALFLSVTGINSDNPLIFANICAMTAFTVLDALVYIKVIRRKNQPLTVTAPSRLEIVLFSLCLIFISYLMFLTFYIKDGVLYVGYSVFSDFAPHLGMIRSFSYGNNFPTQYSHYAGADIRYHFMFQFLVGNLEYLGLPIDWAFNIPSILFMWSVCLLIYALAVKITAKAGAGCLSVLFFLFRSSPSLFRFLAELPEGTSIWEALATQTDFISYTTHEDWGLWNLNVYCNQRHFAFGIALMLLALILFMPYACKMYGRLKRTYIKNKEEGRKKRLYALSYTLLIDHEAILPKNLIFAVFMGLVLGSMAFWNGAVLIAVLLVLFVMALFSCNRLDYLITAVIAVVLSVLQTQLFISDSAVTPSFYFGFLAESRTLFGVLEYMLELWGPLLILGAVYFFYAKGFLRLLMIAFCAPLLFAMTFSLTVDVTVNHKYIMIAAMLLSIPVASFVLRIWEKRGLGRKILAGLLVLSMTATGIFDLAVIIRKNQYTVSFDLDDELIAWIRENTDSDDIFLTANYSLNRVVLAGAMLYDGWPYYAWSAGYDTASRDEQVKKMYEAESSEELSALVEENNISYIIVDYEARSSEDYTVREDIISSTYQVVYTEGEGDLRLTIYDTSLPITNSS